MSYYSEIPDNVGPVRSMRATDIGIVQPLKATLVTSGGAAVTADRINEAGIRVINEKGTGFYREESRSAPYNLFNKLTEVSDKLKPVDPPEPYLPFSDDGSLPAGKPAKGLTAIFSQGHTTSFTFGDGVWTNTNSFAAEATSSSPRRCSCCGWRSATPATPTLPATRCPRRSSPAPARRRSSTTARS